MQNSVYTDKVITYIRSLRDDSLEEIEKFARSFEIPIIREEVSELLKVLIKIKKPKNILEIGTAIGYSSILMASNCDGKITTIEKDESIGEIAKTMIKKYGYEDRINVIIGDAKDVLDSLEDEYDFVFIDGPKGQYLRYLEVIYPLIEEKGIIFSDNVLYHGQVAEDIKDIKRRKRTLVNRLKDYLFTLTHRDSLTTCILPIDDGVSITVKEEKIEKEN